MGLQYYCENSTLTFMVALPFRTLLAAQVGPGIELGTSCMRGRCSDNWAIGTDTAITAFGCIYSICAYVGQ